MTIVIAVAWFGLVGLGIWLNHAASRVGETILPDPLPTPVCGSTFDLLICDRAFGHDGFHADSRTGHEYPLTWRAA